MAGSPLQETTRTTCPYCGVGCGVIATRASDGTVSVKGDLEHPANFGRLCSKGSSLAETLSLDDRLLAPVVGAREASWGEALDLIARRFSDSIAKHGPDSVAFYVSGQILTEDYYVANKLMKGYIGSANIDTNSRLCMASSVAGHRRAFGSDTVPGTYEDLEAADLVVLVGSNLAWCHPVIFQRLEAAKAANPAMRVVVIDPRRTATSSLADLQLCLKPDTDVALFNGLLAFLAETDALNRSFIHRHTQGFDDALAAAGPCEINRIAAETGLDPKDLATFYTMVARTKKTVTVYSQGVNQSVSGTDKVNAILNTHLATGRIGKPGMGPFSITGQPNAMGGREVGGLANMLAAHMALENEDHRQLVQDFWQSPSIASKPGLKAVDLFRAVKDGRIKALWIMATNPVDSLPEADAVAAALEACPFVVVSDVTKNTDTAAFADVLLPAAAWGEKDGTVTNSERRISRQKRFLPLPGKAMPDWWALAEVARRMGHGPAFDYKGPAEIFEEHAALSTCRNDGSRDFDLGGLMGLTPEHYDNMAPVQWPVAVRDAAGTETRFFADGGFYTANHKANFVMTEADTRAEVPGAETLVLNTGRVRDHWHTMTRTGKTPRLSTHIAEPFLEIHPEDAATRGICPADLVEVINPQGTVLLRAQVTDRVSRGAVFAPMHWTDQFSSNGRIGKVVDPHTDPFSGQPGSKNSAVEVTKARFDWHGFAVLKSRPAEIPTDYWAVAPAEGGWRLELAGYGQPDLEALARSLCGEVGGELDHLGYQDKTDGQQRHAFWRGNTLAGAFFFATGPVAVSRQWACSLLGAHDMAPSERFRVLAGRPASDAADIGAIVCSCFGIGSNQIIEAAQSGAASVAAVGRCLKAGTNCGSCCSEISALLQTLKDQETPDVAEAS